MFNIISLKNSILFIILFYFLFNYNFSYLEFYYDDYWFVSVFKDKNSFFSNFNVLKEYYIVRPVGLIYLSLLSIIESDSLTPYYLINISLWLISSIFLHLSFTKIFNKKFALIFLFFFLFPSISSAFIFSPIIQGLSTISIFFWSISIYYLSKFKGVKELLLSIFFIILSFLSYEISFALIPLNIFIYSYLNNLFEVKSKKFLFKIFKIFLISLIIVLLFYFFQKFVAGFSNAKIIKYGFNEKDFFINLKKYFFSPITLIFYEIPKLWIYGIIKTFKEISIYLIVLFLFSNIILYSIIFNKEIIVKKISLKTLLYFNSTLLFVFVGIFLIYLIATSVPDLKGYYNRGLLCLHLIIAIFLPQIVFTKKKIFIIIFFIIFNLNFLSMFQKFMIHLNYGNERKQIINATKRLANENNIIFTNFNTFKKNNYNSIPIFSDEVFDYSNAVNFYSNGKISAHRIYKKKDCKEILYFKNNILTGKVPSRNRKIKEDQELQFLKIQAMDIKNTSIIIFDYDNNKSIDGKIFDLEIILKDVFKCS